MYRQFIMKLSVPELKESPSVVSQSDSEEEKEEEAVDHQSSWAITKTLLDPRRS
jgi:hypothetical protein